MPFQSKSQERLFQGIAHGWHPSGMKGGPSQAVAKKFIADSAGETTKSLPQHVTDREKAQKKALARMRTA